MTDPDFAPVETVDMAVGRNVADLRQRRGLSVRALSQRMGEIGVPLLPSGITKTELGKRPVSVKELVALARALDATPTWLMFSTNDPDEELKLTDNSVQDAGLSAAQAIRLECARLLAEHGTEFASDEDWTVESLAKDVLHLAKAIETGHTQTKDADA